MKWVNEYTWAEPKFSDIISFPYPVFSMLYKYYNYGLGVMLPDNNFLVGSTKGTGTSELRKMDRETGNITVLYDHATGNLLPYLLLESGTLLVHNPDNWGGNNNEWWRSTDSTLSNFTEITPNEGYFRALSRHSIAEGNGIILYGDYNVGAADDAGEDEVKIRKSIDDGQTWTPSFTFPHHDNTEPETYDEDPIRHIHCVEWDPYENVFWVGTGDRDSASRIYKTADGETLELVGRGYFDGYGGDEGQVWRTTSIQFAPDYVYWGMDGWLQSGIINGKSGPYLVKLDRNTSNYQLIHRTANYMFYSGFADVSFSNKKVMLFNNTGEPSTIYQVFGDRKVAIPYRWSENHKITFLSAGKDRIIINGGGVLDKIDEETSIDSAMLLFTRPIKFV